MNSSSSCSAVLAHHHHGKGRVRVLKVRRTDERHYVQQLDVEVLIEGESVEASYYQGDNRNVLPTDTIKNTVYVMAKKHEFESIEDFGVLLSKYFVTRHADQMSKATVSITEENWIRAETKDANGVVREHHHAFFAQGSETRHTKVIASGASAEISVSSGFYGLKVLKTTQSSFENFCRDEYTTLPDVSDRVVGSIVSASWVYKGQDYKHARTGDIRQLLLEKFAGPSDKGTPSPSVQYTVFQMGQAVLNKYDCIQEITIKMPNVHNLPYDQSKFGLKNIHPHGEIFIPVDEPHGIIEATIQRRSQRSFL